MPGDGRNTHGAKHAPPLADSRPVGRGAVSGSPRSEAAPAVRLPETLVPEADRGGDEARSPDVQLPQQPEAAWAGSGAGTSSVVPRWSLSALTT